MITNKSQVSEKGSLALEQVLFIGAVVAMSLGLFAFYDKLGVYFQNFDISGLADGVPTGGSGSNGGTGPATPSQP